jgi:hypothetical protein
VRDTVSSNLDLAMDDAVEAIAALAFGEDDGSGTDLGRRAT